MSTVIKRKKVVKISAILIALIVLISATCLTWRHLHIKKLESILLPKCEEYIELVEMEFPISFINLSKEERQEQANAYLESKKDTLYNLFSTNSPNIQREYEPIESVIKQTVNLEYVTIFMHSQLIDLSVTDYSSEYVQVKLHTEWTYRQILFDESGEPMEPEEYPGETFYLISFFMEDDEWKIHTVNWNPFKSF